MHGLEQSILMQLDVRELPPWPKPLHYPLGVTVGAPGTDLAAACDRIPRFIRPLDFSCHFPLPWSLSFSRGQSLTPGLGRENGQR